MPVEAQREIAKKYVLEQFAVMRKYGSLRGEIQQREFDEIVDRIASLIRSPAVPESAPPKSEK